MIYEEVETGSPIRQGDIFARVPRFDINLSKMSAITSSGIPIIGDWSRIEHLAEPSSIIVAVRPVLAIVISQDCDASRAEEISFCEIRSFRDVDAVAKDLTDAKYKSWVKIITTHARVNQKWFYLPQDPAFKIVERMAVDFRVPMRVPRENVEDMRQTNRVGRLNDVAQSHFRERVGEFFRRYPYDEWYALSPEEMGEYGPAKMGIAEPFPWQKSQ
ncbi:hypothetical protein Cs7R123_29720 [Catellatospora sp. TT07R-123]|uniref:hypothetical protein n=1 Tax=Catellatospora sp. TT07R-123 TaxID=2733863 RepID=UPI001B287DEC|nr:hypothetical protein [Catellatospora sp. TT07R-123]GHJ45630.1 hypothetical protein Cs7R123_29720 [Catellatospora sp. TT07R-123]